MIVKLWLVCCTLVESEFIEIFWEILKVYFYIKFWSQCEFWRIFWCEMTVDYNLFGEFSTSKTLFKWKFQVCRVGWERNSCSKKLSLWGRHFWKNHGRKKSFEIITQFMYKKRPNKISTSRRRFGKKPAGMLLVTDMNPISF